MTANVDDDEAKRFKVQIKERDLLCVNGCGFYGTPQWGNRCSKCWRAHQVVLKRAQDFTRNRTLLSFDNFQERRKSATENRSLSIKRIFMSPTVLASSGSADGSASITSAGSSPTSSSSPTATPVRRRDLSPESQAARESLTDFLVTNLPTAIVHETTRQVKHAVNKIFELRIAPDDLSELVQSFYQYLSDKLNTSPFFTQDRCQVKVEDVMEQVEKYVCTCCYSELFCASSTEEVADVSLQDRIRSLNWVTAGFLETKVDFKVQAVRDRMDEAIAEIIEMNGRRTAEEKLKCLVRCSHLIFVALNESGAATSADEFLPVLIFVLLRGNPPLIQSNVKYISRFALPSRVMSGESGYFFTNLSCALQFVQDMNHTSLKMERSEFEAYTSGQLAPPLHAVNSACNQALHTIEAALVRARKLLDEQQNLMTKIDNFERRVMTEEAELTAEFTRTTSTFPSDRYKRLQQTILEEEKLTSEAMPLYSRQSSDSGHGTLTVCRSSAPGSPQPLPNGDKPPSLLLETLQKAAELVATSSDAESTPVVDVKPSELLTTASESPSEQTVEPSE